jgi:hypothetical protein
LVFIKDAGKQSIQKGDGGQGADGWSLPADLEFRLLTAAAAATAGRSQLILQELAVSIIAAKTNLQNFCYKSVYVLFQH